MNYIKNNDKNNTIYLRETVPKNKIEIPIDFVNFENYTWKINFLNETQFNKTLNEGTKTVRDDGYLSRLVDEYSLKIESNKYFRVIRDGAITIIIFILILLLSKRLTVVKKKRFLEQLHLFLRITDVLYDFLVSDLKELDGK